MSLKQDLLQIGYFPENLPPPFHTEQIDQYFAHNPSSYLSDPKQPLRSAIYKGEGLQQPLPEALKIATPGRGPENNVAAMKYKADRPLADPEAAARKQLELANAFEPVQDGRIYIEKINGPFIYELKGTPAEYKAGLISPLPDGCLWLHESGTYARLTEAGSRAGSYPHSTNSD